MSIKEIAEALNLSKATVSWILSGQGEKKGFSEKTIKRVKDYADSVNYSPNLIARSLSLGTSNTIGLIIPFIDDTFYAQLTMAIEREAIKNKYMLFVCSSEGNGEKEFKLMKALRSKQVDGLIIAPNNLSRDGIDYLKKESFPFVLVDRYYPSIPSNYVVVNNKEGCYDLVKRLAASGAHKIALVTTDVHLYVMKQRIEGYYQALTDVGCERLVSLELFIDRANYQTDIIEKLDGLFAEVPDVDGFFFATHYLALEAIRYFIRKKIDFHSRFQMGCFHDTSALDILAPEMAISRMPIAEMGKESVATLLENIRKGKEFEYVGKVVKNELIV